MYYVYTHYIMNICVRFNNAHVVVCNMYSECVYDTDAPLVCALAYPTRAGCVARAALAHEYVPQLLKMKRHATAASESEGGMIRLETLIELKCLNSIFSSLSSY